LTIEISAGYLALAHVSDTWRGTWLHTSAGLAALAAAGWAP
jgi:hypothetical protein